MRRRSGGERGHGICRVALLAAAALGACSTPKVLVAPRAPAQYEVLGPTEAEYCAFWMPHTRYARASAAALAKVPGATQLINVELQESWRARFVFYRCATIRGEAVK